MPTAYDEIDRMYIQYLNEHQDFPERWLLEQTVYTAQSRRMVYGVLPITLGMRGLDIGTGFGALAFDISLSQRVQMDAIDTDPNVLGIARDISTQCAKLRDHNADFVSPNIDFRLGSVYELPFPDRIYDFAIARFLYQHLENPIQATEEIRRILKPGGWVCLIDIDDQWTITYPPNGEALDSLQQSIQELQNLRGGDRFVGRKLATYMDAAGLQVVGTYVQPEVQFLPMSQENLGLHLTLNRFRALREDVVRAGILDADSYDKHINEFILQATAVPQYHANGISIVLGRRVI